jgi:hypothetical protein
VIQNQTVTDKRGNIHTLCGYRWTNPEGKIETCHAHAVCPICLQCSRLDGEKEHGHCVGHAGLNEFIPVPGNDAFNQAAKTKQARG